MATILEQYRIADFVNWHSDHTIILDPEFQRGSVWTPAARIYLIDTILRLLPIPKIYMRTTIDIKSKRSIREVVDGQQRLRAIIDFANDKFVLSKRTGEFAGYRYSSLSPELQQRFLEYPLAVDQLVNATTDDVLEVFARLNSYTVTLNPPEKRHAKYWGEFKWAVKNASQKWKVLWDEYKIISTKGRVRMLDDSLIAELLGILKNGLVAGGQQGVDRLYRELDKDFDPNDVVIDKLDKTLQYFVANFADNLRGSALLRETHFVIFFASLANALFGIPKGDIKGDMPRRDKIVLDDLDTVNSNLLTLAAVIDNDEPPDRYEAFWVASRGQTNRMPSREVRFATLSDALLPRLLE